MSLGFEIGKTRTPVADPPAAPPGASEVHRAWLPWSESIARDYENSPAYSEWHAARVRSLRGDLDARRDSCAERKAVMVCGCQNVLVPVGCQLKALCSTCRGRHAKRQQARIADGLEAWWALEQAHWVREGRQPYREPRIGLLTLSTSHGRSVAETRGRILRGWATFRTWLQDQTGRSWPYAASWECTEGRARDGHPHLHIAVIWPYLNIRRAAHQWQQCCEGASPEGFDLKTGKDKQGRARKPISAAAYVAKYLSKGLERMPPALAAEWMGTMYGKRSVHASQKFWAERAPACCEECGVMWEHLYTAPLIATPTSRLRLDQLAARPPPDGKPPPRALAGLPPGARSAAEEHMQRLGMRTHALS